VTHKASERKKVIRMAAALGARTQTGCTGKVEGHAAAVTNAD